MLVQVVELTENSRTLGEVSSLKFKLSDGERGADAIMHEPVAKKFKLSFDTVELGCKVSDK